MNPPTTVYNAQTVEYNGANIALFSANQIKDIFSCWQNISSSSNKNTEISKCSIMT